MRGFKPKPQYLADGGLVQSAKRLFGMDAEQNARIAEYRAQAAREKAAAASAAAPAAPASAPAKAITDYSSGGAMKRREEAAGLANGGMIRGPGTGTSDDIDATLPAGSYIMPADSTKTIGPQALEGMGRGFNPEKAKKVPVKVSNGEFNLSPEKVHAIGVETLEGMKEATHTPTGRGFRAADIKPDDSNRAFFADGGVVDERERLRRQTEMYVQGAQAAAANRPVSAPVAPLAERVAQIPAGAPTPAGPPVVAGSRPAPAAGGSTFVNPLPNTTAVARGASEDASAAWNAGNPGQAVGAAVRGAITTPITAVGESAYNVVAPWGRGISSFARGLTGAQADPAAQQPQSVAAPTAAAPVSAPMAVKSAMPSSDLVPSSPGAAPAAPAAPGATEVMPGVFRSGNSYGDSAQAATTGPRGFTGQPSAQNMAAADNLAAPRGFDPTRAAAVAAPGVAAPVARSSANDWQSRNDLRNLEVSAKSITNTPEFSRGATRNWRGQLVNGQADQDGSVAAYSNALKTDLAIRAGQPAADVAAMRENASLQREAVQQQGGIDRENIQQSGANARAAQGFSLDRARVASENSARDVTTQGAQQIQQLRNVLLDPKATPEQRKQAETSLRAVSGKADAANRFTVVPGGQEVSPQGVAFTRPSQVIDNQTGQFIQQGAAAAPQYEVGRVYTDASGKKAKWDGKAWVPA